MEAQSETLQYYFNLPYTAEIKHDEDGWFAKVVELPGCMTWADTFEDLGPMIEDAKRGWIEDAFEHGDPVPEPRSTEDFSGKVNLRMPKSLHRDLARRAQEEDVSLNQLMVATLARSVGTHNRTKAAWRIEPRPPGDLEKLVDDQESVDYEKLYYVKLYLEYEKLYHTEQREHLDLIGEIIDEAAQTMGTEVYEEFTKLPPDEQHRRIGYAENLLDLAHERLANFNGDDLPEEVEENEEKVVNIRNTLEEFKKTA
jgi:antitoxin HicB